MPPSDEGGGFCRRQKTEGENNSAELEVSLSLPQSSLTLRQLPRQREPKSKKRRERKRTEDGRTQFAPTALPKPVNSAQNPCLPREGGVGVADGGSVKGQTPPVSHPLDSPLGEGAKKDCAYARKICTNLTACRRAGPWSRREVCTALTATKSCLPLTREVDFAVGKRRRERETAQNWKFRYLSLSPR